ncbi:MAG TPA: GNAT family N-acetyltransferase [Gemmatimonadales bacterium]|nr:GNAT family N-acetyltransferase [Gemmatimonadales bacterium]
MSTAVIRVVRYPGAAAFLTAAGEFLLSAESENNLILGIALELADQGPAPGFPTYFAAVYRGERIEGCAFSSVPDRLGITGMRGEVIGSLAADASSVCREVTSVGGPEPVVAPFAAGFAASIGRQAVLGMRQRIHELRSVIPPVHPAAGRLRPARESEAGVLTPWVGDMLALIGDSREAADLARERIRGGNLFVWEDGEPVSMAGWTGKTPSGVRVNFVYTPAALRGRGYATAAVAALSQHLLDQGNRYCCLYTDLANPTSNAIYHRIGYRPIRDAALYRITSPASSG